MKNFKISMVLFLVSLTAVSCKKDNNEPDPKPEPAALSVVLNEIMSSNSNTAHDQNGEYDDWIELFNLADSTIDLSGYYLSDSKSNPSKWKFPEGTFILPDSTLIVWADNDTLQVGLHANYKLSSSGESVYFLKPDLQLIDYIKFGAQPIVIGEPIVDKSFARIPNGTGSFVWGLPTFNRKNY